MNIGFTGTQIGLIQIQYSALQKVLQEITGRDNYIFTSFHHGDCVGADQLAHRVAAELGYKTICHPPEYNGKRAFTRNTETRTPKPYLIRNHNIVDESDILIATPRGMQEELRSGTWATVRYARKVGKRVIIIWPDGKVTDSEI